MFLHLFKMHHIGILVMQVKKTNFMGKDTSVKAALLHHDRMEAVRIGINHAGTDAAARALPANNQAVDPHSRQVGDQRRAEKSAGPLLVDDEIARLRLEGLMDLIGILLEL